jgi:hypothetical protein
MSADKIYNTQYGFVFGSAVVTRICHGTKWGYVLEVSGAKQRVEIRVTPSGRIRVGPIITRKEASK